MKAGDNSKAFKHKKTPQELHDAFLRQVGHLRRSIAAYDEGHVEEAERLAGAIYTLFSDGRANSNSAAKLAGVKTKLLFPDSRWLPPADPKVIRAGPPLCMIGPNGRYIPRDHNLEGYKPIKYPTLKFSAWWDQIVYKTDNGRELSRKNLVFAMRHQDGGGHVDPHLKNEAYHGLRAFGEHSLAKADDGIFRLYRHPNLSEVGRSRVTVPFYHQGGRMAFETGDSSPPPDARPIEDAHWASMRQIAWEADQALALAGY